VIGDHGNTRGRDALISDRTNDITMSMSWIMRSVTTSTSVARATNGPMR
jgi:hypothetical protein